MTQTRKKKFNFIELKVYDLYFVSQMTIIQHRLTYPTGSAVAHLINNFHTPQGALLARYKQEIQV